MLSKRKKTKENYILNYSIYIKFLKMQIDLVTESRSVNVWDGSGQGTMRGRNYTEAEPQRNFWGRIDMFTTLVMVMIS